MDKKRITIAKAAEVMRKDPQYVRIGIQQGILPFGRAVRVRGERYSYYISPRLFEEFTGWKEDRYE